MKNKHVGPSFFEDVVKWEKQSPTFRKAVEAHKEKAMLGLLLKKIRAKEQMTQIQLAKLADVPQSVIARIETGADKTLPRIDAFSDILLAAGYATSIVAKKGEQRSIRVALSS